MVENTAKMVMRKRFTFVEFYKSWFSFLYLNVSMPIMGVNERTIWPSQQCFRSFSAPKKYLPFFHWGSQIMNALCDFKPSLFSVFPSLRFVRNIHFQNTYQFKFQSKQVHYVHVRCSTHKYGCHQFNSFAHFKR